MEPPYLSILWRYGHLLGRCGRPGRGGMPITAAFTGLRRNLSDDFLTILHAAHKMNLACADCDVVTGFC
jgi:hypothetical protein